MDIRYAFVYIGVNIFCFIVATIMISKFSLNLGSEKDVLNFRSMIICFMVFLFAEVFWALGYSNIININPTIYGLVKAFGTFFVPFMVYYWHNFALNKYNVEIKSNLTKIIIALPIIILSILYISSFFTGIVFKIGSEGIVEYGPGVALSGLVDNIYGIIIIIHSLYRMIKNKDKHNNYIYITQIVFIVICTIGGILDAIVVDTPIMQLAICLSFLFLFINIQEPYIYNDYLTGLNNRRRMETFMKDIIDNKDDNWHLFIIDIDNFKNTNDTKGHIFGDSIIKVVADALNKTANEYKRGLSSRWGGDEFVVIVEDEREDFIEEFKDYINNNIKDRLEILKIDYPVSVSVGHYKYDPNKIHNLKELVDEADKRLYIAKRKKINNI